MFSIFLKLILISVEHQKNIVFWLCFLIPNSAYSVIARCVCRYLQNTNLAPVLVVAASSSNSISIYNVVEAPFGAVTK